jgi:hypothetical protein
LRNNFIPKTFCGCEDPWRWLSSISSGWCEAYCLTNYFHNKATGITSRRFVVSKEPVLASALLAASLLAATLFFMLTPLTFTFLSLAIFLSALLSGACRLAGFVWIALCVHDAFLCY